MRSREKQRIFKLFMEGESAMKLGKDLYFNQDPYRPGWTPWRLTMCIEQVEQAIRECVWDVIGKAKAVDRQVGAVI